jgi:hypothetical protein
MFEEGFDSDALDGGGSFVVVDPTKSSLLDIDNAGGGPDGDQAFHSSVVPNGNVQSDTSSHGVSAVHTSTTGLDDEISSCHKIGVDTGRSTVAGKIDANDWLCQSLSMDESLEKGIP